MYAFVPNFGLSASRTQAPLQTGLSHVCATPITSSTMLPAPRSSVQMSISGSGITLQTLRYTPSTTISAVEDKDIICYQVWKQVFGNAYVMESEREEGYVAESMFRAGRISLKEFVRGVAQTSTYRRRFFECCGPYRAVELNIKHLLGRGPNSQAEVSEHVQRIVNEGYEADINSYIDSVEYEIAFTQDYLPEMRFKGTYNSNEEFNRMCTMYSSPGTTDKSLVGRARSIGIENPNHVLSLDGAGYPSRLVSSVAMNGTCAFISVAKAIPSRPDLEHGLDGQTVIPAPVINEDADPRRRVEVSMGNYMYLKESEIAAMQAEKTVTDKIVSFAEREILEAKAQIALLEEKISELTTVQ